MKKTFDKYKNYDKFYELPSSSMLFPPFIHKKIIKLLEGDILDIGGATGEKLINLLNKADYNKIHSITLIEPSPLYKEAIKNLKGFKRVKIHNKELKDMLRINKRYDVILFFEIIEHLEFPETAIKDLKRILKPNGILILSTPNKYIYHFLRHLKKEQIDPTHISEMTCKELETLMEKNFKISHFYGFFPLMFIIRKYPKLDIINKIYRKFKCLSRTIYVFSSNNMNFRL